MENCFDNTTKKTAGKSNDHLQAVHCSRSGRFTDLSMV